MKSSIFIPEGILLDLDGTLLNSKRRIEKEVIDKILIISKFIPVSVCTGRPFASIHQAVLSQFNKESLHIVSGGGQLVYTNGTVLWENKISSDTIKSLSSFVEEHGGDFAFGIGKTFYCSKSMQNSMQAHEWGYDIQDITSLRDMSTCLIAIYHTNDDILKELSHYTDIHAQKVFDSHKNVYFDITASGVNKGVGVKKWCEAMHLDSSRVTAVGDNLNDIDMFHAVGHKVVVSSAPQEVLDQADEIIDIPDNNGLSVYLEKILSSMQ